MQKSHWYLMTWLWKQGNTHLAPIAKTPAILPLTTGYADVPDLVPRIEVGSAFRTLGVYITPNGSQLKQVQVLRQYATHYSVCVSSSTLTSEEAYISYMSYLRPRLIYILSLAAL